MNQLSELIHFNQGKCVNGKGLGTCVCKMTINPQSWSCKTLYVRPCTTIKKSLTFGPSYEGIPITFDL